MATGHMRTWTVRVHRDGGSVELGQVHEASEELARCAALCKFSITDDDADRTGIGPFDDFDVSPA